MKKLKSNTLTQELQTLKESLNLIEYLESYELDVPSNGMINCLFHADSTPSMYVEKDYCYCHVCSRSWDIFDVAKELENLDSVSKSAEFLRNKYSIPSETKQIKTNKPDITYNEEENMEEEVQQKRPLKSKQKKPAITQEVYDKILASTSAKGNRYRGISDRTLAASGVRTEYNEAGEVVGRYYLITEDFKLVGIKKRICDKEALAKLGKEKSFLSIGRVGTECDLYGARHYRGGGKTLLIVGGEEDREAAIDMINSEYFKSSWNKPCVVSPVTGEGGLKDQIKHNYKWINSFDEIVLALDNDEPGIAAMEKCYDVLPKEKLYTLTWQEKDPNEYLKNGKVKEFVNDLFKKRKYVPDGIVSSADIDVDLVSEIKAPRLSLPKYMKKMQDMCLGGFPLGIIVNIAGISGGGKTTHINEAIYHWCFNSPYTIVPVSLELSRGQYAEAIYSRHLGIRLYRNADRIETILEENKDRLEAFKYNPDGSPRFYLIDDRDLSIEDLQNKILEARITLGARYFIFDPLNDLFDGLDLAAQQDWMSWEKRFVKSHNSTLINVCHLNKIGSEVKRDREGNMVMPTMKDFDGASHIFKSGAINIVIARDANAEDSVEKNTTYAAILKGRGGIDTGMCGEWYYDPFTHTVHDRAEYLYNNNGQVQNERSDTEQSGDGQEQGDSF